VSQNTEGTLLYTNSFLDLEDFRNDIQQLFALTEPLRLLSMKRAEPELEQTWAQASSKLILNTRNLRAALMNFKEERQE